MLPFSQCVMASTLGLVSRRKQAKPQRHQDLQVKGQPVFFASFFVLRCRGGTET